MTRDAPRRNDDGSTTETLLTATIAGTPDGFIVTTRVNGGASCLTEPYRTRSAASDFVGELGVLLGQVIHTHHMITRCSQVGPAGDPLHVALDRTKEARAEALVNRIAAGQLGRPLLSEIARYMHYPAMAPTVHLAWFLRALANRLCSVAR